MFVSDFDLWYGDSVNLKDIGSFISKKLKGVKYGMKVGMGNPSFLKLGKRKFVFRLLARNKNRVFLFFAKLEMICKIRDCKGGKIRDNLSVFL